MNRPPTTSLPVNPAAPSHPVPAPPGGRHRRGRRAAVLLIGLLALLTARAFVVEPMRIPSASMAPTLLPGQHVLAEKVNGHRGPRRGDVVAFTSPRDQELMIKRVVGLAGDTVAIRDGRLVVDAERVEESYADPILIDSVYYGPVRVPDDEVLVLGDNRAESVDSRSFGTVPTSAIQGRVVAVLWPPADIRRVRNDWRAP